MGLIDPEFDAFFLKCVQVLSPYLDELVIVGGTANALYRAHPLAMDAPGAHPGTTDLDLAVSRQATARNRPPIPDLIASAGLKPERMGHGQLPVMKFRPAPDSPLEVEFLCPASGNRSDAAWQVQAGLTAQPIQYLGLLLFKPWTIEVARIDGLEGAPRVQVPNPYCYVMQKVLNHKTRRPDERTKDLFYIYEISVMFRDALDSVVDVGSDVAAHFPARWTQTYRRSLARLFESVDAPGPVEAARMRLGSSDVVFRAVRRMVDRIEAEARKVTREDE